MKRLEEDGLFSFEFDEEEYREKYDLSEDDGITENDIEDEKSDAFDEWLTNYKDSLDDDEKLEFYEKYYGSDLIDLDYNEVEYKVEIPEEIIG
ncbi:MAG: hypothetical protein MJZ16_05515 [Bacteroidales bacterium]|nr:hypothetical protein [Bacteroidales bacterium]